MVSFRYVVLFLNILHDIFSIKFYTVLILCEHNFFVDEKHTQWMLDTKESISWNDPETVSHDILWKKTTCKLGRVYN